MLTLFRHRYIATWALAVGLVLALTSLVYAGQQLAGNVSSFDDGDSFYIGTGYFRAHVRLCGIDAPERRAAGHQAAKAALSALFAGKPITCRAVGNGTPCDGRSPPRNRDRWIAQCFLPDGTDVAIQMLKSGHACECPNYSGGKYGGPICARGTPGCGERWR